jgi:hypothetical protein
MQWALLAVIIIALFLLSGRYPKVAFGILGALVIAAVAIILLTEDDASLNKAKIGPGDVMVENIAGIPAYGGGYRLTGRIKNNHESAELKEVMLSIMMEDCMDSGCEVVGQTNERVNLRVPADQARDFSVTVYLGETSISGSIRWSFDVIETRS